MNQIIHHLKNSNNVLLASHINPDGDAIASLLSMGFLLDTLNKQTTIYNQSPVPSIYHFLPSAQRIVQNINSGSYYDTAIILDCGDLRRIGKTAVEVNRIPVVINIDHHITNTRFGDVQLIDTSACATTEIIYRLFKEMAIPINLNTATSIYTGILTDTGSFRFSNTNRSAFEICAEMTALGVDPYDVAKYIYGTYSVNQLKLIKLAIESIEISQNRKLSLMTLTQGMLNETGTKPEDINGLINYIKNIENIKIAVLIQEPINNKERSREHQCFHVSLRSDKTVDVATIAASFGGGGHPMAAGFSIKSNVIDLKKRIFSLAETL
ncbi:MAG: bifunctional oligoribonuclease/PAP phosphatase NrnA [Deltaproteobacteria bacterium]|nr:bifunctional oligoribonuclease/PAP phosphatase NrnA [Deltaproteobacteria bacterium]MBW2660495.1 bifunctional oligoribonuclease/PAP phosphatase NrnA [Deltaproteobacteria bacterium]